MSSLQYRKDRMTKLADAWHADKVRDLFISWDIPKQLHDNLTRSIGIYVAKALNFEYTSDETEFMKRLDANRDNRTNVTPNGGVVPKKEYALEYNNRCCIEMCLEFHW